MQVSSTAHNHACANMQWGKWKTMQLQWKFKKGYITLLRVGHKWPPTQPNKNQTIEKAVKGKPKV